jgi:hypothetical protein
VIYTIHSESCRALDRSEKHLATLRVPLKLPSSSTPLYQDTSDCFILFHLYIYLQSYLEMEFSNPNVAAEMAQILKHYQDKYVPCFTFADKHTVLGHVPVHGDQLFEERARNVQWTH